MTYKQKTLLHFPNAFSFKREMFMLSTEYEIISDKNHLQGFVIGSSYKSSYEAWKNAYNKITTTLTNRREAK